MHIYLMSAAVIQKERYATLCLQGGSGAHGATAQEPDLFSTLTKFFPRFGRFDRYTRWGCAASYLALREAGLETVKRWKNTGFLLSGQYGSFITDLSYYSTTNDGGALASAQLFSYTLPNIIIGECALRFGLTGPTYCLDSEGDRGREALRQAAFYLRRDLAEAMLVGWLEALPVQAPPQEEGAIVVVLANRKNSQDIRPSLGKDASGELRSSSGERIESLDDFLAGSSLSWFSHSLGD